MITVTQVFKSMIYRAIHVILVRLSPWIFFFIRNTIFRKAPPSVVSGYGKRSINLNKVVATFEKHIFLSQTDIFIYLYASSPDVAAIM
jgi:hypothetical protein